MMKKLTLGVVTLSLAATALFLFRYQVALAGMSLAFSLGGVPDLLPAEDEGDQVAWHDDYYTIEQLDSRTFAIGEPRYYQQNISYLIMGEDRAILFDAGAGSRKIRPVAEELTALPITFVPSHFHYDHVGDGLPFDRIAVVDLPHIRSRASDNQLTLTWQEHLGEPEGFDLPTFSVAEWLTPGADVDLGGRVLTVIYTPGHTTDSISLFDPAANLLFAGDFIYQGPLLAFLPNSSLGDYAQGAEHLSDVVNSQTKIYGAHRLYPPGAPVFGASDVKDLQTSLRKIRNGNQDTQGLYPVSYPVNDEMTLWAEPPWLQNWDATYPD
jgi:glyoxylase-like metal-dependent hydrolase (beta-lactamase superfamily II)